MNPRNEIILNNPILVVDDDADDREMVIAALKELDLPNELLFFSSGKEVMDYLSSSNISPFLIICDVNMPKEDGFKIRQQIEENPDTHYKSVPFIFWSTAASENQIKQAYDNRSQGFFLKPDSFKELKRYMRVISEYWTLSQHPKQLKPK